MTHRFARRSLLVASAGLAVFGVGCKKVPATCPPDEVHKDDLTVRSTLGYVDQTPDPAKPCVRCVQYVPAAGDSHCGSCKIMKGPIHPNGYCNVFAPVT